MATVDVIEFPIIWSVVLSIFFGFVFAFCLRGALPTIWFSWFFCVQDGVEINSKEKELKRLGFLRVTAIQTLVCVSSLYGYAKQNSGPLRSTVGAVEGAVTAVVGPVYQKFKGVPDDVLAFLDTKVSSSLLFSSLLFLTRKKETGIVDLWN